VNPEKSRWLVLLVVSSALFLVSVDVTVLYIALPSVARDLDTTASQKIWIVNAYVLVVAGLLPGLGTLGDRVGHKRMFVIGLAVFGIASLGAAYSPTAEALIAARAVCAVGAAMMVPATLSIVSLTFADERERAFAIGIWGAIASGGALIGPVIGGVLVEYFHWGSVFLINVPIVAVALVAGGLFVPRSAGNPDAGWDLVGSLQILVGLVGIAYAIESLAHEKPPWAEAAAIAVVGLAAMAIFVRRQRRGTRPMIDFALLADADFTLAVIVALVSSFSVVGLELVLSQRLQLVLDYSPLQAALFVSPGAVMALLGGPLAGWLAPRLGNRRAMIATLVVGGLGVLGLLLTAHVGVWPQILSLSLFGLSEGAAVAVAAYVIMSNVPAAKAGMAASIQEFAFEFGGAISISILGAVQAGVYAAFLVLPKVALPPSVHVSVDKALEVVETLPGEAGRLLSNAVHDAFDQAYLVTLAIQAALLLGFALRALLARSSARNAHD
jgi:MFS transporter, DHA2 family, multidrug resistance protein